MHSVAEIKRSGKEKSGNSVSRMAVGGTSFVRVLLAQAFSSVLLTPELNMHRIESAINLVMFIKRTNSKYFLEEF